jgi:hypothetical protein
MGLCPPKMSVNIRKCKVRKIITLIGCGLLVLVSLITFQQQIPTISQSSKVYDREYIDVLRKIGDLVPQNETLATSESYPQVTYFTDHKVKVPRVASEKSLVEFMWKTNSSYLLVPYHPPQPKIDSPLLVKFVERPFEQVFDYYTKHISKQKPDNIVVSLHALSKGKVFKEIFQKVYQYDTNTNRLELYRLQSNITLDKVTDGITPVIFVTFPTNGTTIESGSDVFRVNVTGTSMDTDSKVKRVEVSFDGLVFQSANPRAPGDWSTWSSSHIVTSEGTKKIVAKATDNADNKRLFPIYITIK